MRITQVSYRKLVSGPGFSHQALEATCTVDEGENPDEVLGSLERWVERRVGGGDPRASAARKMLSEAGDALRQAERFLDGADDDEAKEIPF